MTVREMKKRLLGRRIVGFEANAFRDGELSPATPELGPAQQKIMDLLSDADGDPMGPVEISDTTGIACGVTRTELTKLKKKGLADNPQRGQWVAA